MFKLCVLIVTSLLGCTAATQANETVPLTQSTAPVSFAWNSGPVSLTAKEARGKTVYAQCIGCHSPERNRTGPKHCGLIGRKTGTVKGFEYSDAMRRAGVIWTRETLDQFLYSPIDYIRGTNMTIAGVKDNDDRRDFIAYLVAMNHQPECD